MSSTAALNWDQCVTPPVLNLSASERKSCVMRKKKVTRLFWCCSAVCCWGLSSLERFEGNLTFSLHFFCFFGLRSITLHRIWLFLLALTCVSVSLDPLHVCSLVFLLAEHWHVLPTPSEECSSFFLRGHVYLRLIKQAPHFLMPGPRQEVCWHQIQAWPGRGGLL